MIYNIKAGDKDYRLALENAGTGWKCELDGDVIEIDARLMEGDTISLVVDGKNYDIKRDRFAGQTRIWIEHCPYVVEVTDPRALRSRLRNTNVGSTSRLVASMPGKVLRVLVSEQERVEAGQALLVVEAMKMQNEIKSPAAGIVRKVISEGTHVNAGELLAIVE